MVGKEQERDGDVMGRVFVNSVAEETTIETMWKNSLRNLPVISFYYFFFYGLGCFEVLKSN